MRENKRREGEEEGEGGRGGEGRGEIAYICIQEFLIHTDLH